MVERTPSHSILQQRRIRRVRLVRACRHGEIEEQKGAAHHKQKSSNERLVEVSAGKAKAVWFNAIHKCVRILTWAVQISVCNRCTIWRILRTGTPDIRFLRKRPNGIVLELARKWLKDNNKQVIHNITNIEFSWKGQCLPLEDGFLRDREKVRNEGEKEAGG